MIRHPSFDELSTFCDQAALGAGRAAVASHVTTCEECRNTVREIRALGDDARAVAPRRPRADLWSRIEAARADSEVPSALADERPASAAHAIPSRRGRLVKGLVLGGAAIVLAIAAGVLYPSNRSLQATALSRLSARPARPAPGEPLVLRYDPAPYFRLERRLIVAGWYSGVAGSDDDPPRTLFDLDSLGTLLRRPDGIFEGRVTLPPDFRAMHVAVLDSSGDRMDRDGRRMWRIVGGTADHSPSLPSLLAAEEGRRHDGGSFDNHLPTGPAFDVADTIRRYFPGHPAGWAFYRRFGVRKGVWDFLGFFESAERKYLSLDEQLSERATADADSMHAMFVLATRIEEPGEALKWSSRLARAHPADPHAFRDLYGAVHQLELRSTPGLRDSMRSWLPLLADSYHRALPADKRYDDLATLVHRLGDDEMRAAWPLVRELEPKHGTPASHRTSLVADGGGRAREQLSAPCQRPAGRFSLYMSAERAVLFCQLQRSQLFVALGEAALERGDARRAVDLADSAIATARVGPWACWGAFDAHAVGARAKLALGDTIRAVIELAASTGRSGRPSKDEESLAPLQAIASHRPEYDHLVDSTRRAFEACWARQRDREKARADSMRVGVR